MSQSIKVCEENSAQDPHWGAALENSWVFDDGKTGSVSIASKNPGMCCQGIMALESYGQWDWKI